MKIIALLSAYDESASWLATVVAGAARFCDAIVYVDGAYALYPGARPRSMPDQAEAVIHAAEAADIELILHRPKELWWGNEVQKRNQTLKLAGTIAEPGDWLVVFDGDMHLMKSNPEMIRWDLEHTDCDVATMTVQEGQDMLADEHMAEVSPIVDISHEWNTKVRLLYRWHPTLEYGPLHWSVSYKLKNGRRRWLWGPQDQKLAPAIDLLGGLVSYHRNNHRTYVRKQAAKGYYDERDARKIEVG